MLFANIIPFTGLDETIHTLIFLFGVGMCGSILTGLVFPRIFSPLFLNIKRMTLKRYKDAYIENSVKVISLKKYLKRVFYCILTTLGFLSFVIPRIDLRLILDSAYLQRFEDYGISPGYSNAVQITLISIFMVISVGIWSIGWAIEDAGLMHFSLQTNRKGKEFYEIEPIHLKFFSYLKGFAGITSIFYLFELGLAYGSVLETNPGVLIDLLTTTLIPIGMIIFLIPAYLIYSWKGTITNLLRKNLKQLKKMEETDIYLKD
jgi:hypothetical protein